jgi:excisionase family DNA binding protein
VKNKNLVSIPKFAKLFGLTAPTVRTCVKSGELPYYDFGRTIRLDVDEIEALVYKSRAKVKRGVAGLLADQSGRVAGLRGTARQPRE